MIEIRDMSFGYTRELLFTHLDLVLEPGNIYGLLGKNGAGKTTLLKLISGLRFAPEGECRVLGYDPRTRPVRLLEEIYLVTEEFAVPPITADTYQKLYAPFYPRFDKGVFHSCLKEFELNRAKKLTTLSYGQKKKFLLAFGMATGSRIVLMDEPTNGLDIPSKSQFRKLLAQTVREDQIILISTHQVRDMENLIDPIIILDEGRIIFTQPMNEVTRRLSARLEEREPSGDGVLYADKTLGGWVVVRPNRSGVETRIDLETLFNTVIANRNRVSELFIARGADKEEARHG